MESENIDIDVVDNGKIFFHMHNSKFDQNNYIAQTFFFKTLRIVKLISGDLVWMINDKKYFVDTGDIIVFNNMEIRKILSVNEKIGAEIEIYEFLPTAVGNSHICLSPFFKRAENFSNVFKNHSPGYDLAINMIDVIRNELFNDRYNKVEMIRGQLISLLVILSRFMKVIRGKNITETTSVVANAEAISDITAYIHNNINENLKIDSLAKKINMSQSNFSKLFKLYNNISPYDYIRHMRINNAIQLLHKYDYSIIDAAFESGFKSSSAFYKAFQEILGMPPKKYIKSMRG